MKKVLVTGATGFVGSAVVSELTGHSYQVTGLARSDRSAEKLTKMGVNILFSDLEDLSGLKRGASSVDAVIHTGFLHDFSNFERGCRIDVNAIDALAEGLQASQGRLIVTSGLAFLERDAKGQITENSKHSVTSPRQSEVALERALMKDISGASVRLANSVHDEGDHGFIPILIDIAKKAGFSAYIEDGLNCWTAVHRQDAARLFRLALEATDEARVYHGCAEQKIPFKAIARMIGEKLKIPTRSLKTNDAKEHFQWFYRFASIDGGASSDWTQESLGWKPAGTTLAEDVASERYPS